MNNIYKVIWSKAKNCYVVASEIARSHTKSASGSEKIGGVARHALLALGAACAIACGGFVNVGAVEYEHVDVTTTGTSTATVYTKNGTEAYVENALSHFDTKDEVNQKIETLKTGDVATNKNDIAALQATTIDQGQKIATNTANIANNKDAIDKKIDKETANATYATKEALNNLTTTVNGKADLTALEAKADKTYVDQKFTEAGTSVDTKLANYATTAYVDGKIADEVNARDNKITAAIGQERTDRDAAINTAIAKEVADRNQAIDTAIAQEVTDRNLAVTNAKAELQGKITAEETARKAKDLELEGKITQNSQDIATLDKSSVKYDNPLAKDTITLAGPDGTKITHLKDATLSDSSNDAVTGKQLYQTNERTGGIKRKTEGTKTTTTIENEVTVDNSGNVGGVKGLSAETITTGNANIGTLTTTGQATFQDAVEMNNGLKVTNGATELKETTVNGTLTTTGQATFQDAVEMNNGLKVTNGATELKETTVNGTLTTTGQATFQDAVEMNNGLKVTNGATELKETTVNGTLTTTGQATFQDAVEMNNGLKVTNGATELKETTVNGTLTTTGQATFQDAVEMNNGLKVTNGATELKETTVNGTLTTTGQATFQDAVEMNNGLKVTNGATKLKETNVEGKLDVSDTDGNNKANLSVKAGEGVKASATDGTTTGSLDVKADGITTSITNGTDHNTVSSTLAGGTIFSNSEAAAPVTGASSAGTAVNTTIKGNTITTGKVTMDYAEVMKDLGVHGNAKIDGKTTTDSLEVTGTSTLKGNVTMESDATVKKNLTVNGITTTKTLKVTENAEIDGNAIIKGDVTARSYKVGDKTYIDANGIHANNQKITDVADGSISEGSKDAVNGGQLYGVKRDLEHQVDKVGANAAAMANLRPMEFDPSSKWNIAAAIGNYGSETAAALGAFYRPNDDVMVNLSTAFGTGENMVGGGVSVRLGKSGNKLSREENNALKAQVDDLTARMDALLSVLNPNMSKDFPDVPENHWAYEAVSRLAGNDIVQGYPDGEFHGERTMTRYEMAEIIYNALSRGAEAEKELVEEFKPELQAMAASEKATAEKAEG